MENLQQLKNTIFKKKMIISVVYNAQSYFHINHDIYHLFQIVDYEEIIK